MFNSYGNTSVILKCTQVHLTELSTTTQLNAMHVFNWMYTSP